MVKVRTIKKDNLSAFKSNCQRSLMLL